jgi:hypothetical protein
MSPMQANGLPHAPAYAGNRNDDARLQRLGDFSTNEPRALPWAGMIDALGVAL